MNAVPRTWASAARNSRDASCEAPLGCVGAGQVVQDRRQQVGSGGGRQHRPHLVQHPHRRSILAQVEVGAGLHLHEARAQLDREIVGERQAALRHPQHLLVATPQVEHLAEPDQRQALARAVGGGPAALEHLLVERPASSQWPSAWRASARVTASARSSRTASPGRSFRYWSSAAARPPERILGPSSRSSAAASPWRPAAR